VYLQLLLERQELLEGTQHAVEVVSQAAVFQGPLVFGEQSEVYVAEKNSLHYFEAQVLNY
jgi:hypothetical protein